METSNIQILQMTFSNSVFKGFLNYAMEKDNLAIQPYFSW